MINMIEMNILELSNWVIRSGPIQPTTDWSFNESIQPDSFISESKKFELSLIHHRLMGLT